MNPTSAFFSKLRKLALTLESETAELQQLFENRNDDDEESSSRSMRAFHKLNCEVGTLKEEIQGELAKQKTRENEMNNFLKASIVMQQKVTKDIQILKGQWEKYGYEAPKDTPTTKGKDQRLEAGDKEADENEANSAGEEEEEEEEEEGGQGEDGDQCVKMGLPPFTDVLRTPQLSDFGLSEVQLKRTLAGTQWCSEVPPMPEMILPQPSLNTPAPPPMPITPKRVLRMDDEELQTPQMHDFGISEHTMCLNNEFTMDLFRKNIGKPRSPQDKPLPPMDSLKESLHINENLNLESPEPPVICTPGFKIKKSSGNSCLPLAVSGDPESPGHPGHLPTTPEVPAFKTPYMKWLVSNKKSVQQPEQVDVQGEDNSYAFKLVTPTHDGAASSKHDWDYNVPEISILGVEDKQLPEMPTLESVLGNSLQTRSAKIPKICGQEKVSKEPTVKSLELDGPTQDFSLGTPRIRMDYEEPTTPEMPDLSSITQDICKLVSQAQLKKADVTYVQKENPEKTTKTSFRAAILPVVSENEFQSLPSYLKQMTLHNLNQAVNKINKFTADLPGEKTEFHMEELKKITNVGTKTPVYILCLTELKRLDVVKEAKNKTVFKICMKT
ncbi:SKA complex subunit 3 isoform X2 [Echeneis naucrates]|uniref:SKA complex subunit 3 isoform X2 n=1 Tax=Echeneis naucrates TaxID=173247 RepID=UPI001114330D|nr:spindle and kinetochore-associated protein 3 isoform X2 [Echeneis naucrates]